jgi:polyisoprenyl-phosphate glycosyltransferase
LKLSVVIPVFNEAENLPELTKRVLKVFSSLEGEAELIYVNDGSTDGSTIILDRLSLEFDNICVIHFTRNFGHQQALYAGMLHSSGDLIVTMDADLQDPPELIPQLFDVHFRGPSVVYARRKERLGENWVKKATAFLFYRLLQKITAVKIPLDTGDFRLISREVFESLKQMPEQNRFLRGQIAWLGYPSAFVDFDRDERRFGKTKFSMGKMIRFALDGITSFSNLPLQLASFLGFLFSAVAFLVILYALYAKFVLGEAITGWTSIIISAMFIGGIQLLAIGIIGEYIGRIAGDVRRRPDYIIRKRKIRQNL